jgi:hypothetical protein
LDIVTLRRSSWRCDPLLLMILKYPPFRERFVAEMSLILVSSPA